MATEKFFQELELPQQKSQDGVLFPAVLSPNYSSETTAVDLYGFKEAIRAYKTWLESLLNERGVIFFRGFPVKSSSDFNDVVEAFGFPEAFHVGGRAPRTKVVGRVYTASEYHPDQGIPFHHEMAYVPDFPSKLFFFCEEEPGKGGETPVVLSHLIYEKMKERHPDFVGQLEEHGLTFIRVAGEDDDPSSSTGSSWKSTYKTEDKNVAEQMAAKQGTKLEWIGNDAKIITGPVPAIRFHKETQRNTWLNTIAFSYNGPASDQSNKHNTSVELGNGDLVPDDAVKDFMSILEEECVAIPWKKGDVMLVNNLMVLHSRRPLLKPPRRILASLNLQVIRGVISSMKYLPFLLQPTTFLTNVR